MENKISFKQFFSVIGRGIWQAIQWVVQFLGFKKNGWFGKLIGRTILICITLLCIICVIGYSLDLFDQIRNRYGWFKHETYNGFEQRPISKYYTFVYDPNERRAGFIRDERTGEIALSGIVYIKEGNDDKSLAIFMSENNKLGYLNCYTAQIEIEPQFDKAWPFSSQLAAVKEYGEVFFIDNSGYKVVPNTFVDPRNEAGYSYHGNYCAVNNEDDLTGLIDRMGDWVIEPKYLYIDNYDEKYWRVEDEQGHAGVMTDSLTFILPVEYTNVEFAEGNQTGIYATKDGVRKLYDFDGKVKNDFIFCSADRLWYPSSQRNEEGKTIPIDTDYFWYRIDDENFGLMDKNGKPLTPAIYESVTAIDKNVFQCEQTNGNSVLLDQNGKLIN